MVGCEKDTDFLKIDGVQLGQGAELAAGTQEENTFVYVFFFFPFVSASRRRPCNIMHFGTVSCHFPNSSLWPGVHY